MMKNKKDIKILIVVPRFFEYEHHYIFPVGLGYISSVIKKEGYDVDCLNLNHYKGTINELVTKKLNEKKYDFVCTGNNALGYAETRAIVEASKKHESKPRFILGGAMITSEPKLIFEDLKPDFGVIGEGEETIVELLDCLNRGKNLSKVKGIIFKKGGETFLTEKRMLIENIDSLPFPDTEGLEFSKQLENMHCNDYYFTHVFDYPKLYPILGSRGCPFNCTFCYHYSRYRKRSVDSIMQELNAVVKKYKINIILLNDECFAVDKERLYEFCRRIKKFREELSWELRWAMQLTVQHVNEEMLKIMKDAGCDSVSYGFESYSKEVLRSMRKPITPEQINKALHETIKAGIGIQANLIFGDIAETEATSTETLDWWKKNAQGQVGLGFIQPYPGSEIYEHCLKKGIIKDRLNFIKNEIAADHWYNMTDNMTDKEIGRLKKEILDSAGKYCRFVKPISIKKQQEKVYEVKVKCPFCRHINDYKNCFVPVKWRYGFYMLCRSCKMRFFIVGEVQKLAYRYYSITRVLRDLQLRVLEYFRKRRL